MWISTDTQTEQRTGAAELRKHSIVRRVTAATEMLDPLSKKGTNGQTIKKKNKRSILHPDNAAQFVRREFQFSRFASLESSLARRGTKGGSLRGSET